MDEHATIADRNETDIAALERFVVENDDLLELEERIGRFNIFDALRIDRVEIRHSNFLAWLLDPNESHGQGALFLRAILMDLFKSARENGYPCPVSPIDLDGEELRGVEIRREWRHVDLLITCHQPRFVVAIENKIDSGEHNDQLKRYRCTIENEFGDAPSMYAFLTVEGDEPSEEDWVPYSYGDVHWVLTRVRNANEASIGDDVLAFLDHYLRLIRGRLMDDPKIDELCQRIYKTHRQAIDLIVERLESPHRRILDRVEQYLLTQPDRWHVLTNTPKKADFIPQSWTEALPDLNPFDEAKPPAWLRWWFYVRRNSLLFLIELEPVGDPSLTSVIVDRLRNDKSEFGFQGKAKVRPYGRTRIFSTTVLRWEEDGEPDDEQLINAVSKILRQVEKRLADVPDALRPIIEAWQRQQSAS